MDSARGNANFKEVERVIESKVQHLPTEKEAQFEKLWEGDTPSGKNEAKALQFRQKMKMALVQKGALMNKENARMYWLGTLNTERERIEADHGDFRDRDQRNRGRPVRR
ncbi:MAG: hypothetical protein KIY11_03490 [Thermoplasmata archaeon]|nr:hypothetical protein [Candidatus Sysuiplasma acidicola]MDH2906163.1 hypothetical protein [Methanomassiliicoccales archaeon]